MRSVSCLLYHVCSLKALIRALVEKFQCSCRCKPFDICCTVQLIRDIVRLFLAFATYLRCTPRVYWLPNLVWKMTLGLIGDLLKPHTRAYLKLTYVTNLTCGSSNCFSFNFSLSSSIDAWLTTKNWLSFTNDIFGAVSIFGSFASRGVVLLLLVLSWCNCRILLCDRWRVSFPDVRCLTSVTDLPQIFVNHSVTSPL